MFFTYLLLPVFSILKESVSEDGSDGYYTEMTLAELVEEFLSYLNSSPGSFETDIEHMVNMLNRWVTTEETLQELVELIYTQVCVSTHTRFGHLRATSIL